MAQPSGEASAAFIGQVPSNSGSRRTRASSGKTAPRHRVGREETAQPPAGLFLLRQVPHPGWLFSSRCILERPGLKTETYPVAPEGGDVACERGQVTHKSPKPRELVPVSPAQSHPKARCLSLCAQPEVRCGSACCAQASPRSASRAGLPRHWGSSRSPRNNMRGRPQRPHLHTPRLHQWAARGL